MDTTLARSGSSRHPLSRRRLEGTALACFLACGLLAAAPPALARPAENRFAAVQGGYLRTGTIGDVLARWRPDVHLYVLGDVGLEDDALRELAAWLDGRHWTVLLVQDATGQTYKGFDWQTYTGEGAIEYGTGQGIPKRPGFLEQVHPRTQEPNGAIFTIVLAQRSFFYTASAAQDNRALGEGSFQGNLDQWAIEAMRSGAGIPQAVRDTVTHIDARVDEAIEREALESRQARENVRRSLQSAVDEVNRLEELAAGLRKAYPRLDGPLAHPDIEKLRQQVAEAEPWLDSDPQRVVQTANSVRMQAATQIAAIEAYPSIGKALAEAEAQLAALQRRERAGAALLELDTARQMLTRARELYDQGAPSYDNLLSEAGRHLFTAEQAISKADRLAASGRALAIFFLIFLGMALLGTGFVLNLRRRGVRKEAGQLLAAWRNALDEKLGALLDELEQRVARFVGPASGEGQRPWAGETLRWAEQIRADVGSLYILWTSANSVLQKAEALIHASGLGAVSNFFLPGKYRQGIALLKDEPVPFDPASGLPKLFGSERTWRDDLLGDLASYEPFSKSFQDLVGELDLRARRAAEALSLIEAAVLQGPSLLEQTGEKIAQTTFLRQEIEQAGAADGLFLVPAIFSTALPAAADSLARAHAVFPADPVGALRIDGARAQRIALESWQLADLVMAARRGVLPAVEAGAASLRNVSIATGWIEADRIELSGRADHLAEQTATETTAAGIEELSQGLADLGLRVERAVALARVLEETARPEALRVAGLVQSARADLGAALGLPPDRILREEDLDPSERLDGAGRQAAAAQAALGQGELDTAEAALDEAGRLTIEAENLVEAARQAYDAQEVTVQERRAETTRIEGLLPGHEQILAEIRQTYAPSVLLLRAGDPDHPDANGTLGDNLEEARGHVGLAHEKLDRAVDSFRNGRLLTAAGLLREVKRHQELAVYRLEEIAERQARLARTVETNRDLLQTLEARVREDQTTVAGDPRVMQPTLAAFDQGRSQLQEARRRVEASPGDPFLAEEALLAAQATLGQVHDQMAPSDRALFAEAQRSVEAANRQLVAAGELARRAATDNIPDSPGIVQGTQSLRDLSAAQEQARAAVGLPHGDWHALDAEADRIAGEAARWAATLTGELAAAEKAVKALSAASGWVRTASSWSDYGVTIDGNPGSNALSRARSLLERGRYDDAGKQANVAFQEASQAIEAAKAEASRQREADRRLAEAYSRQRAEEESRRSSVSSSFSSSSHHSSGSSSSSWGSSSSGSSRSSWGSSSSGSGKSGW